MDINYMGEFVKWEVQDRCGGTHLVIPAFIGGLLGLWGQVSYIARFCLKYQTLTKKIPMPHSLEKHLVQIGTQFSWTNWTILFLCIFREGVLESALLALFGHTLKKADFAWFSWQNLIFSISANIRFYVLPPELESSRRSTSCLWIPLTERLSEYPAL